MVPEIVQAAFDRNEKDLLGKDGVVGVGMGKKVKGGKETGDDAVIVLVKKKRPISTLLNPVPPTVYARWYNWETVPTDVIEVGDIQARTWGNIKKRETTRRRRPALGGDSCGHFRISAGTLGVVAHYNGQRVIFSNNHVLANSGAAQIHDPIYQPGPYDGGGSADYLADLLNWVPLKFDGTANFADAAIALPANPADVALGIMGRTENEIIIPDGFHTFAVGERGPKRGRTTDWTELRCIAVGATVNVGYGAGKTALCRGCEIFDPPGASAGGDSGSVILYLDEDGYKMGSHLFAGSDEVTVGFPIAKVFELLGLTIAVPVPEPEPEPEPEPPPPVDEPEPEPEPPPPVEPIEPVELLTVYVNGKVAIKATVAVENGKIVVR